MLLEILAVSAVVGCVLEMYTSTKPALQIAILDPKTGKYSHTCKHCGEERLSDGQYSYRCECNWDLKPTHRR